MKSGSATNYLKTYTFFDQLRFLDTTTKDTTDSIELNDLEENSEENGKFSEGSIIKVVKASKEKSNNKRHTDDDLLDVLKKNTISKR